MGKKTRRPRGRPKGAKKRRTAVMMEKAAQIEKAVGGCHSACTIWNPIDTENWRTIYG
jgi:hypothetical protein